MVEADIKGFFDNIDHDRLIVGLSLRIADQSLLRLIKKWLKAGVLDTDGKVIHPTSGTPQGGIISPLLANVYLHYALDAWFQEMVKAHTKGEACLIRYADDFVCAFEDEQDAQSFFKALEFRLEKFGLQLAADKTRVIHFSRSNKPGSSRFDFLGFEFRWDKDRTGKPHVVRRTSRKKLRNSIANFTQWCKQNRNLRLNLLFPQLNRKLRGYYNYYGVRGNFDSLNEFYQLVQQLHLKWLNRRSQRQSYTWAGYRMLKQHFALARPRIVALTKPVYR